MPAMLFNFFLINRKMASAVFIVALTFKLFIFIVCKDSETTNCHWKIHHCHYSVGKDQLNYLQACIKLLLTSFTFMEPIYTRVYFFLADLDWFYAIIELTSNGVIVLFILLHSYLQSFFPLWKSRWIPWKSPFRRWLDPALLSLAW